MTAALTRPAKVEELRRGVEPLPFEWADAMNEPHLAQDILEGVIGRATFGQLFGPPGSGKTFVAFDIAGHVATGGAWNGRRVQRGTVVYLAAEAGVSIRNRVIAWKRAHQVDELPIAIVTAGVDLRSVAGDTCCLVETVRRIAETTGEPVVLVIVDTLSRAFGGGDENDSADMGALVRNFDDVRHQTGAAVLVVHHAGKDATKGARGHSLLRAAVDVELEAENDNGRVTITVTKSRDGAIGARFVAKLRPVEIGTNVWGEPIATCVLEPSDDAPKARKMPGGCDVAMRALRVAIAEFGETMPGTSAIPPGARAVHGDSWRRGYFALDTADIDAGASDPKAVERARDARLKRFTRARKALQEAGVIGGVNDRWWLA